MIIAAIIYLFFLNTCHTLDYKKQNKTDVLLQGNI